MTALDRMQQLSTATCALFTIRDALALLIENDLADIEKTPPGITAIIRMAQAEAGNALRDIGADP